jgi:hypothetical protein
MFERKNRQALGIVPRTRPQWRDHPWRRVVHAVRAGICGKGGTDGKVSVNARMHASNDSDTYYCMVHSFISVVTRTIANRYVRAYLANR